MVSAARRLRVRKSSASAVPTAPGEMNRSLTPLAASASVAAATLSMSPATQIGQEVLPTRSTRSSTDTSVAQYSSGLAPASGPVATDASVSALGLTSTIGTPSAL